MNKEEEEYPLAVSSLHSNPSFSVESTSSNNVQYQGNLMDGVDETTLCAGGATMSIILAHGCAFNDTLTKVELKSLLVRSMTVKGNPSSHWNMYFQMALNHGDVSFAHHSRQLRVTLGPMPNFQVSQLEEVTIMLQQPILSKGSTSGLKPGSFLIHPTNDLTFTTQTPYPVVGSTVKLLLTGHSGGPTSIVVIHGVTCRGERSDITPQILEDGVLMFTPNRGGTFSICNDTSPGMVPASLRQVRGTLLISGPESIKAEPEAPKAMQPFFVNIFGTGLSVQDSVGLSKEGCNDSEKDDFIVSDLIFTSSSRGGFHANTPSPGNYNICYLTKGSQNYVSVGTVNVLRGVEMYIDGNKRNVVVDRDTLLSRDECILFLTIESGTLNLGGFHLNVTHFTWTGGNIEGPGRISITGDNSKIDAVSFSKTIDFNLHNFGNLLLVIGNLHLAKRGSITNYNQLLISGDENSEVVRITTTERENYISNTRGSTMSFRMSHIDEDLDQRIVIDPVVRNYGRLVHEEGVLVLSYIHSVKKGNIELSSLAVLNLYLGKIESVVSFGEWSELNIQGPTKDDEISFKIDNAHFINDGQAALNIVSGKVHLVSSQFSGSTAIQFGGVSEDLQLSCDGIVTFSPSVSVRMSHTTLSSAFLGTLNFYGDVVFDMSSIQFGDNVVVQSRLSTVTFSNRHNYSTLLPQNMNINSSFVVPWNASLVIIDQASVKKSVNRILDAPPAICNNYVVVPTYIFADDDIKLSGCAMLPFGGSIKRMLYGPTAELVEVSLRYAYCKTAIFGGGECVKIKPRDYSGILVSEPMPPSGPLSTLSRPQFDANDFPFDGVLNGKNRSLDIVARESIVKENTIMILSGEGIFNITNSFLNTQLLIDSVGAPLLIEGPADLHHSLVHDPLLQSCTNQVQATVDDITNSVFSPCSQQLQYLNKVSQSLVTLNMQRALLLNGELNSNRSSSRVNSTTNNNNNNPNTKIVALNISMRMRYTYYCLALVASVVILVLLHRNVQIRDCIKELSQPPPIQLDLMNCELNLALNFRALCCLVFEAFFLCLPAFHATFLLSPGLVWLSNASEMLLQPCSLYGPTIANLSAAFSILWGITRIPLHRNRYTDKLLSDYSKDSRIVSFFQFHTHMALFAPCLFIPILSVLFENVLRNSASLAGFMTSTAPVHFTALCLFVYYVPYNGSSPSFPFLHPPFQLDLDVRFKREFIYIKYTLIFLLVVFWNVSLPDPVLAITASFVGVALLFLLTWYAEPCGYRNINTICRYLLLFPMWGQTCSGIQLLRFYGINVVSDVSTDMYYFIWIICGWIAIALRMYSALGHSVNIGFNGDAALTALLKVIVQGVDLMNECQKDMYNCNNARDREVFASNLSELYMRHLKRLTEFRRHKEAYLLPYYIGPKSKEDLLLTNRGALDRTGERFLVGTPSLANQSFSRLPINTGWVLTFDMMDSFVKGDLLGSGSYGRVYRGMIDSKLVAVKEILVKNKSKSYLDKVKKEIDIHKTYIHPNLIRYYGCHTKRGCINIFMELASGSLNALAKKFVPIPERNIKLYTQQILTGLSYLHKNNIAHSDIKGENILIANDNDDNSVAKIADFGCTIDISQNSVEKCFPLQGSLSWMAPEVIRQKQYTTNIDIWSVGCTVIEMLNGGQSPWAESFDNLSAQIFHLGNVETQPSNIPNDISEGCRIFLSKCFERDPTKRPSALELLEDEWLLDTTSHPQLHDGGRTSSISSLMKSDIEGEQSEVSSYNDSSTYSFISEDDTSVCRKENPLKYCFELDRDEIKT